MSNAKNYAPPVGYELNREPENHVVRNTTTGVPLVALTETVTLTPAIAIDQSVPGTTNAVAVASVAGMTMTSGSVAPTVLAPTKPLASVSTPCKKVIVAGQAGLLVGDSVAQVIPVGANIFLELPVSDVNQVYVNLVGGGTVNFVKFV